MRVIANLPRKAYKVGGLEVGAGGIVLEVTLMAVQIENICIICMSGYSDMVPSASVSGMREREPNSQGAKANRTEQARRRSC